MPYKENKPSIEEVIATERARVEKFELEKAARDEAARIAKGASGSN